MLLQNLKNNKWLWLIIIYTIATSFANEGRSIIALLITIISGIIYLILFWKPRDWSLPSKAMVLTPFFLIPNIALFMGVGNYTAAINTIILMIIIIVVLSRIKKSVDAKNRFMNRQKE